MKQLREPSAICSSVGAWWFPSFSYHSPMNLRRARASAQVWIPVFLLFCSLPAVIPADLMGHLLRLPGWCT
jgi:hypothetical protein